MSSVDREHLGASQTARANRRWWDDQASEYYDEHAGFLGDDGFVWGPEGWTEAELSVLDAAPDERVLEIGSGAAQCSRWLIRTGTERVAATDLSFGMLHMGRQIDERLGRGLTPLIQADARALPFAAESFDAVFTSYGVLQFVADVDPVFAEVARVLRPGGRFVFSAGHPIRWAFPDDPGERGLTATMSYFDRRAYVERDGSGEVEYAEHHRTLGDLVRAIVRSGLILEDLIEPEWPERNRDTWGGWSPTRGALIPGTMIAVVRRPQA